MNELIEKKYTSYYAPVSTKANMVTYMFRRRKKCFNLVILMLICVALMWSIKYKTAVINKVMLTNELFCYNLEGDNVLPAAESKSFFPNPNSIFFHETSCRGKLNSRQACTIESAARAHPDRQINVLFSSPINEDTLQAGALNELRKFDNIVFARLHLSEYAKGTPMEEMILSGALNNSVWPITHASDVLRFLTLYKWSGIYMDLDMIVVKPFDSLSEDFAAREEAEVVGSSILAFSQNPVGRMLAEITTRDLATNFRGDLWGYNGPLAITRALQSWCNTPNVTEMSGINCKGFEVYDKSLFYPIPWLERDTLFEKQNFTSENAYTVHIWNQFTKNVQAQKGTLFDNLAKKYCPTIYKFYGERFGK